MLPSSCCPLAVAKKDSAVTVVGSTGLSKLIVATLVLATNSSPLAGEISVMLANAELTSVTWMVKNSTSEAPSESIAIMPISNVPKASGVQAKAPELEIDG